MPNLIGWANLWVSLLNPVVRNVTEAVADACRASVRPVLGSVVYTDLFVGYIEHSGIYVGNGQIANLTRCGDVTLVSPQEFMRGTTGRHIYVSSRNGKAVGSDVVAHRALQRVSMHIKYEFALRNCHWFANECIPVRTSERSKLNSINPVANLDFTLSGVKRRAEVILGANEWRYWDI